MNELLKDLELLLEKHNASIVRSANNRGDLYLCKIKDGKSIEMKFNEDITDSAIKCGWHSEPEIINRINNDT